MTSFPPIDVAAAAQLACLLEASAPKPGNVSPGRHFEDLRYEHFLASAAAIGEPLAGAGNRPVGETVWRAIEATSRWTSSNSNLGIVLLLAPIARATASVSGPRSRHGLRAALGQELEGTTVEDARQVYRAIRLAAPGGLGRAEAQDVADEPDVTLLEAMILAADRDGIAREYATRYDRTFDTGVIALSGARSAGLSWDDSVVETFLVLLAGALDTHIVRRFGEVLAGEASSRARDVLSLGGVRSVEGRRAIEEMDRVLRADAHRGNPGTTADLTAAAAFVYLLTGGWETP